MYQQIVVGTDGSAGANAAVDAAVALARASDATLHVVYAHKVVTASQVAMAADVAVVPVDFAETNTAIHDEAVRICDEVVARASGAGVRTEAHCVGGNPVDALLEVARDTGADLVVVGNRGMSGLRGRVLGSIPDKLSHHCDVDLLIVDTSTART